MTGEHMTLHTSTVLRHGQRTRGMMIDGPVVVHVPSNVTLKQVDDWVEICVMPKMNDCCAGITYEFETR